MAGVAGGGSKHHDALIKVLTIGDSDAEDQFATQFITTIGIDFKIKFIQVGEPPEQKTVKMQMWDTAGQERFRTITRSYFRGAHSVVLVYDVSNQETFDSVQHWMGEIQSLAEKHVAIVLVGNKCDLPAERRAVSTDDGKRLAERFNVPFFETSAKTGVNVDAAFQCVATMAMDQMPAASKGKRGKSRDKDRDKVKVEKGAKAGGGGGCAC